MRTLAASLAAPRVASVPGWRTAVPVVAALALALGFLATPAAEQSAAVQAAGPELTLLLRMMAGLKLAFVVAGIGFSWWRLGHPVRPTTAAAYLAAVACVSVSPGLIWDMAHIVLGAALLHGGLAALVALGWLDRDLHGPVLTRLALRRG